VDRLLPWTAVELATAAKIIAEELPKVRGPAALPRIDKLGSTGCQPVVAGNIFSSVIQGIALIFSSLSTPPIVTSKAFGRSPNSRGQALF
jgi:hypothetical protein